MRSVKGRSSGEEAIAKMRSFGHTEASSVISEGGVLCSCIEFGKDAAGEDDDVGTQETGVIAIPCGTNARCLSITPALNIEAELLETAFEKIDQCMKAIEN